MARNLVSVGGERPVNLLDPLPRSSLPLENGILGAQVFSRVAPLSNGNFVVVYQNDAGGKGDLDILSMEFTPDGNPVGVGPFRVDFDAGDQTTPDVAPRSGGGFVAVWEDEIAGNSNIHLTLVSAVTPSNPTEFVVADFAEDLEVPRIATFENGSYIVVYERAFASNNDIWFAIVNPAADSFAVVNTGLVTAVDIDESMPAVDASGGIAAVVFTSGEFSRNIQLSIVSAAGAGIDFETVADIAGETVLPDVIALSDGRFLVTWSQVAVSTDVMGRIYDPDTKTFSGKAFKLAATSADEFLTQAAPTPDGGFIATWLRDVDPGPNMMTRRFDAKGAPAGDVLQLNLSPGATLGTIASNDQGRVFATWTGIVPTSDDPDVGIRGRFFRIETEPVNGSSMSETIVTYGLSETIKARGGNDKVNAKGGNDLVSGGSGKDDLTGGPGRDKFLFDAAVAAANADRIRDFDPDDDRLHLDRSFFTKLKKGGLADKFFFAGKNAEQGKDKNDHLVYDTRDGEFRYDKDGKGGAKGVLIARLDKAPDLDADHIVIVA